MDRRDFIRNGVLGGAAAAAGLVEPAAASHTPFDMEAFWRRADAQILGIANRHTLGRLTPRTPAPLTAAEQAASARAEELLHKSMRSLLLVGLVQDIPEEHRNHESVQQRLAGMLPEMDDSVYGLMELMTSLSPADRIDLKDAIGDDPQLPMRVMEALDEESEAIGISAKRRLHLRSLGGQVAWRLRHQSPSAVVDEYVNRAERLVVARGGHFERERQLAARAANEALWALQAVGARQLATTAETAPRSDAMVAALGDAPAVASPYPPAPAPSAAPPDPDEPGLDVGPVPPVPPPPPPPRATWPQPAPQPNWPQQASDGEHPGRRQQSTEPERERLLDVNNRMATAGGILMGLGGVGLALSISALASGIGWAFVVTAGVVFIIVGLIIMLVGLVRRLRYVPGTKE